MSSVGLASVSADYWHQGMAEISRFDLLQVRYGEVYRGRAILIFVKEDFLPLRQVKYDGEPTGETPVTILKHIGTRDFITGLYPYSVMTTVFSPFSKERLGPYKVTATTQDWCGQTFMQVNERAQTMDILYGSYFQSEGDQQFSLPSALLEDGIWNMIRTDPATLPLGRVECFPSLHCVQLRIKEFQTHVAEASLHRTQDLALHTDSIMVYSLKYEDVPRVFSVRFEAAWPHRILAWEETEDRLEGRSANAAPLLRTRAVRTHTIMDDYWNHASPSDSTRRAQLGLRNSSTGSEHR